MKWIVLNQINHLQSYIYFYLKQPVNYKHMYYRDSEDFDFFQPDRAILITNQLTTKSKRFIQDAQVNNVFLSIITENELLNYNYLVREKRLLYR